MKRYFTLIELVVVVAMSSVLFCLLAIVGCKPREDGKLVECSANLKKLYEASASYSAENDDYYVMAYDPKTGRYWFDELYARAGTSSLHSKTNLSGPSPFICPAIDGCYATDSNAENGGVRYGVNYGYNGNLQESKVNVGLTKELVSPEKMLLFGDAYLNMESACTPKATFYVITAPSVFKPAIGQIRPGFETHDGKANICWADGHVAPSTQEQFKHENVVPEWK